MRWNKWVDKNNYDSKSWSDAAVLSDSEAVSRSKLVWNNNFYLNALL